MNGVVKKVTQITSKTTGVEINAFDGRITTVSLTDAADGKFDFTVTNQRVRKNSNVHLQTIYAGTTGAAAATVKSINVAGGSFIVTVKNVGIAALNDVATIQFKVTK
jgi:hypothetical protein